MTTITKTLAVKKLAWFSSFYFYFLIWKEEQEVSRNIYRLESIWSASNDTAYIHLVETDETKISFNVNIREYRKCDESKTFTNPEILTIM